MSERPHTVSPWRRAFDTQHEALLAAVSRTPSSPESSVTIGVTAKRLHTWEVVVRGEDVEEIARVAKRIDDELAAKFADEVDTESLAGTLARSVKA